MSRVLQSFTNYNEEEVIGYNVRCPGCKLWHSIYTVINKHNKAVWGFDGNMEKPTFTPSILVRYGKDGRNGRCHSFIRKGIWEFLGDCTHELAGQKVPMIEIED